MNCQIRGLTAIRKGLGKEDTTFLVISNSIITSENVSGRVSVEDLESLREAIFSNPEGSQSGGVSILPIRRGLIFANLQGRNPEGLNFDNPEGSYFCQSGGVPILPIRRGTVFVNPEGYYFC